MNSKEIILNRIAGAAMPPVDYPAFDFTPLRFEDRTAAFAEAVKAAGGQVVAADGNPLTELIRLALRPSSPRLARSIRMRRAS